jgi:cellulose synthase/poly-beta-1,6-N-acetylglucosamine synthase-like glycosyltransferase
MSNNLSPKRIYEIIPGALSWGIILSLLLLSIFKPLLCAVFIIAFDFYWIIRTVYLTTLLVMAHRKLFIRKDKNWIKECDALGAEHDWQRIYQLIIFPVYKEGPEILRSSLKALTLCNYPKDRMIVVLAFEARNPGSRDNAKILEEEFGGIFFAFFSTFHPDGLTGETRTKGANATWAAQRAKEFLGSKGIKTENILVSCFDADTCVDKEYFGCLAYHFLTNPKPHQASYQPMPVYNNNIWEAPSFARLVEISASFCEMIDSVRLEKFVTFSSHSMSFKTLVEVGYWPVDMISDDSVIYWKAFLFYKGEYHVVPLYINVSMDVAYANGFWKTIAVQYKQKRRWAWGVENFPFLLEGFSKYGGVPLLVKIRRAFNLLESHVTWAVWAVILALIGPMPLILGGAFFRESAIGYNLPRITGLLFNFTLITSLVWVILSRTILPKRPSHISWRKNIVMVLEWVIVPFIIVVLGSVPALDAQTRLALGKYMEFNPTEKKKKVV